MPHPGACPPVAGPGACHPERTATGVAIHLIHPSRIAHHQLPITHHRTPLTTDHRPLATSIIIFGGTFDPPHVAHTLLPPLVAERIGCERIIYVPAAVNPLKADETATDAEHRLAMLRLALAASPDAEICTDELERPGPSYTVDTLETLREAEGSETELRLLIGSDQALDFHRWKDWQRILDIATPVVMIRPPPDDRDYETRIRDTYPPDEAERWLSWTLELPQMDVCATEIRKRLADGEDVSDSIDPAVLRYIREHGLYQ